MSDIEIAQKANKKRIIELANEQYGIDNEHLEPYGHYKAKLSLDYINSLQDREDGKLILTTAISATPAGEGKTTTTVGLGDAMNRIGKKTLICLREPSLGPCFGVKGGAAGGGHAQVVPMEDINLHFTGDFHAIGAAHNLLSAMIDNHINHGNALDIDPRLITWKRVLDMNDRALRDIVIALGGTANGFPRENGFDITVASEVMAIFCLAENLADLQRRLAAMVIGTRFDGTPVTARDVGADGAMAVLLRDALQPNLVQSIEHSPALIHGGPFANIAHGCNSVMATRTALGLSDVVVTEAGFGADLGAEKFLDIKCRQSGLRPDAAVLVCTIRALKAQGGVARSALAEADPAAVRRGAANLRRHVTNLMQFGLTPIVAVNRFLCDDNDEIAVLEDVCAELGVVAVPCTHWAEGGRGATDLARAVMAQLEAEPQTVQQLYPDDVPLADKVRTIATRLYGAADIDISQAARRSFAEFEALGYGHLPVCIAKTQYSFSADPKHLGAPEGHILPVREARLSAGAGFVVAVCGDIMTMPGLPRRPAALDIGMDDCGGIKGLS